MTDTVDPTTRVAWLSIAGNADTWRSIGLTVDTDGTIPLHGTALRIVDDPAGSGIVGWGLSADQPDGPSQIDGLPPEWVEPPAPLWAAHDIAATGRTHQRGHSQGDRL